MLQIGGMHVIIEQTELIWWQLGAEERFTAKFPKPWTKCRSLNRQHFPAKGCLCPAQTMGLSLQSNQSNMRSVSEDRHIS